MLFGTLISGHGFITTPTPRELLGNDKRLAINNGDLFKALTKATTAPEAPMMKGTGTGVKSEADILANLNTLGATFPGVLPCRYNPTWKGGNVLTSGLNKITWTIPIPHPGTCVFRLIKKGLDPVVLGKPFLCSQEGANANTPESGANGGNMDVKLPDNLTCSTADECSIQWFWNGNQQDQQYLNCVDFTTGGNMDLAPNSTTLPISNNALPINANSDTSKTSPLAQNRRCKAKGL